MENTTTTDRYDFGNGTWAPLVGGVAIVDSDLFNFDSLAEATEFADTFGGTAYPVIAL